MEPTKYAGRYYVTKMFVERLTKSMCLEVDTGKHQVFDRSGWRSLTHYGKQQSHQTMTTALYLQHHRAHYSASYTCITCGQSF